MCFCGRYILNTRTTSWTIPTRGCSEFQKQPPSATAAVQHRQQRQSVQHQRTSHRLVYIETRVLPLLNLLPRDFKSTTFRGEPLCICSTCTCFAHWQSFVLRPRVVSCVFGCGAPGGAACTIGCEFGPLTGLLGASSGGSKSRELAFNHGIAFRDAEPPRTMKAP